MTLHAHAERTPQATRESWPAPLLPLWRGFDELFRDGWGRKMMAVEEFTEGDTLVVRAEMADIDPDKDVEITVADGMLHIAAERTDRKDTDGRHFHRRELRYGSFARSLPLPDGVDQSQIAASYRDGILEVRVPLPPVAHKEEATRRVPVTRS